MKEVMTVHKLKQFTLALLACVIAFLPAVSVSAEQTYSYSKTFEYRNASTGYSAWIQDEAAFISSASDEEFTALVNKMIQITDYANVGLVTTTDHEYSSTENYAVAMYENHFGYGSDGVIFAIDRDLNQIYLISEGGTQSKVNNTRCTLITDNTYIYATSSHNYDYYTCANETFKQIYTILDGHRIVSPMKIVSNILLAIALGMLLNYFLARALSKPSTPSRKAILAGVFTSFNFINPDAKLTHTTKRYDPPSSSSGGGGGGHSGGGGGGGGGGHSGGGHGI